MKKFISGMLLLAMIFVLSSIVMLRTQVSEPQNVPTQTSVHIQPTQTVQQPVENIVEPVEEPVEEPVVHVDSTSDKTHTDSDKTYTDEELEILALIVYQEAGGDNVSDSTRRLVAQVFFYLLYDSRFPDSFY